MLGLHSWFLLDLIVRRSTVATGRLFKEEEEEEAFDDLSLCTKRESSRSRSLSFIYSTELNSSSTVTRRSFLTVSRRATFYSPFLSL